MRSRRTQTPIDGLANILLPLSRALVHRNLGVGPLVLAAKLAYLRAAIEAVPLRGKRPNVSRLSVATGMTRKEVSLLLKSTKAAKGAVPRIGLEQRAFRVVRGWITDPRFKTRNGKPAPLSLKGAAPNFSTLVRTYGGDVTLSSVLAELERTKVIEVSGQGNVRLKSFKQSFGAPALAGLSELALLLSDFVDTASQVMSDPKSPPFFGFHECLLDTESQTALFERTFARRAAALLASVGEWRTRALAKPAERKAQRSRSRVGLGVYLVRQRAP